MDQRTGTPMTNWARGNYGSIRGRPTPTTWPTATTGSTSSPFPGMLEEGMMGANYG